MTAILHCGLRYDFFISFFFSTNLLFPISIWTFISLFSLDFFSLFYLNFYFPSLLGFFFSLLNSFLLVLTRFNSIAVTFWISSKFFLYKTAIQLSVFRNLKFRLEHLAKTTRSIIITQSCGERGNQSWSDQMDDKNFSALCSGMSDIHGSHYLLAI